MARGATAYPLTDRLAGRGTWTLAACLALAAHGPVVADDRLHRLQGLFCNTEEQIDGALARIAQGWSPRAAAELTNGAGVVCTNVDRLEYLVDQPVAMGDGNNYVALVKYRAMLVGVVVGGQLRAVSPPAEVFFVTPKPLIGAALERRT